MSHRRFTSAFNEQVNVIVEKKVFRMINFDTGKFGIYLTGFYAC